MRVAPVLRTFLCCLVWCAAGDDAQTPLIFMGGLGASMMRAKLNRSSVPHYVCSAQDNDYPLWLYYENLLPFKADCWLDNMRVRWQDGQPDQHEVKIHFIEKQESGGISKGFSKSTLWTDLLDAVADLGYKDDSAHVHALHYDWRLSILQLGTDGTFARLKAEIEAAVTKAGNKPAILVTLSYAGPIMHAFMSSFVDAAWKKKFLARWISLSGTFGGSAELVRIAFYPEGSDFFNVPSLLPYITLEDARSMSNTFASTFIQWPQFLREDEVLLNVTTAGQQKLYTSQNIGSALVDSGLTEAKDVFEQHKNAYSFHSLPAPGIDVDCIYGVGDDTMAGLQFANGFNHPATGYANEDGDGVATSRSLRLCGSWHSAHHGGDAGGSPGAQVRTHEIAHAGHGGPLHHKEAVALFGRIVREVVSSTSSLAIQV